MGFLLDSYRFVVTASGNETTAEDNAMTVGGVSSAWVSISSVNDWDGTNWTAGTALATTIGINSFRGNTDGGINCGGYTGTSGATPALNSCQTWNGSSWTTRATMSVRRSNGTALGGTEDSALIANGQDGSGGTQWFTAEQYDGSANSWSSITNSTFGGQSTQGYGIPDDFIKSGGKQDDGGGSYSNNIKVETWNGSSWTTLGAGSNYPNAAGSNGAGNVSCSCGVGSDSFMLGFNADGATGDNVIYKFDGSSWTNSGDATTSPSFAGMGGSSDYAIICGDYNGSSPAGTSSSIYNGSSWSTTNALQTGRTANGTGATTAS